MTQTSRLMADVYDSARQALYMGWDDDAGFQTFLGRLRLDCFLHDRVVLTDQSLLDGVFILDAAVRGTLSKIPWSRIDVKARAPTLFESFVNSLHRPGAQSLVPTWFSSFAEDALSLQVSEGLGATPNRKVEAFDEFAAILTGCGLEQSRTERQCEAWQILDAHVRENAIPISVWDTPWEFEHFIALDKANAHAVLSTKLGRDMHSTVWAKRPSRNVVRAQLEQARRHAEWDETRDLATIDTWYNFAYQATLARQHGCDSIEMSLVPGCRPYSESTLPLKSLFDDTRQKTNDELYRVPPDFLRRLGGIEGAEFEEWMNDQTLQSGIAGWRRERQIRPYSARDSFKRSVDHLVQITFDRSDEPPSRWKEVLPGAVVGATAAAGAHAVLKRTVPKADNTKLSRRAFFSTAATTSLVVMTDALAATAADLLVPTKKGQIVESIVRMEEARQLD